MPAFKKLKNQIFKTMLNSLTAIFYIVLLIFNFPKLVNKYKILHLSILKSQICIKSISFHYILQFELKYTHNKHKLRQQLMYTHFEILN